MRWVLCFWILILRVSFQLITIAQSGCSKICKNRVNLDSVSIQRVHSVWFICNFQVTPKLKGLKISGFKHNKHFCFYFLSWKRLWFDVYNSLPELSNKCTWVLLFPHCFHLLFCPFPTWYNLFGVFGLVHCKMIMK